MESSEAPSIRGLKHRCRSTLVDASKEFARTSSTLSSPSERLNTGRGTITTGTAPGPLNELVRTSTAPAAISALQRHGVLDLRREQLHSSLEAHVAAPFAERLEDSTLSKSTDKVSRSSGSFESSESSSFRPRHELRDVSTPQPNRTSTFAFNESDADLTQSFDPPSSHEGARTDRRDWAVLFDPQNIALDFGRQLSHVSNRFAEFGAEDTRSGSSRLFDFGRARPRRRIVVVFVVVLVVVVVVVVEILRSLVRKPRCYVCDARVQGYVTERAI